jgi:hypothetical protein
MSIAAAISQLWGCGGGGGGGIDVSGLSSGGTGSFTSGTITGLGSIIVNGIRYDDTAATVTSDDASGRITLALGMVVNVAGSAVVQPNTPSGIANATAYQITSNSEWIGPVSNISNIGGMTFQILGNTVEVVSGTIFAGAGVTQWSDLSTSHFVVVYGYVDTASGHLMASRIEASTVQPSTYKLSGLVSSFSAESQSLTLGLTQIRWSDSTSLTPGLGLGSFVRAYLQTTVGDGGTWRATKVLLLSTPLPSSSEGQDVEAEIFGTVTAYTSPTAFVVNGITVQVAPDANVSGTVSNGVTVQLSGTASNGILLATYVAVKSPQDVSSQEYEFYGTPSNVTAQSFVLRGQTIYFNQSTRNRSLLTTFPLTKVKVVAINANGQLLATEIEAED